MRKSQVSGWFMLLLLLMMGRNAFAGIEQYQGSIKGKIKKNDTLVVKDGRFNVSGAKSLWVKDAVFFTLADEGAIDKDFTCSVALKLEYLTRPGQQRPDTQTVRLKINYSTKAGATYKIKDSYAISGAYWLRVTVSDISSPELGSDLPAAFELGAIIDVNRKYAFNPKALIKPRAVIVSNGVSASGNTAKPEAPKKLSLTRMFSSFHPTSDTLNGGNQLQLYWSSDLTADEYDIEWATADSGNYYIHTIANMAAGTSGTVSPDTLNRIFLNNATRVTTADTSYLVSLVSNDNYILVRMRKVQYTTDGIRLLGDWDYSLDTGYAVWKLNWYQQNLNWQYSAAYAEEGKKKEVVSYFDGTLRGRQTVTINNSNNVAVVQENVYDEFGRATASLLPAPYHNSPGTTPYLHYFRNFNVNGSGSPYNADNVRGSTSSDSCEFNPDTLNAVSGASQYYSSNNPFLTDVSSPNYKRYNFYIPNANGFPLSITEYTNDNTGRLKLQGGVGKMFQPGDSIPSKTTKYYYGKPEQWELDQLFGNDVGYASHYLKNMVVDPNGQISVSYVNASGKTIATALTGPAPAAMDSLVSSVPITTQTIDLLDSGKFVFDNAALKLSATTTYLASVTGPASLKYSIKKLIDKFPADSLNICSNCFYNLNIKVANDCNQPIYNTTTPISIGSATAACDSTGIKTDSVSVTIPQVGEYYVTFTFDLSKTVIENYADSVITKGQAKGVIKTEFDFILPFLDSLDFKSCLNDCSTCVQVLGSQTHFTSVVESKLLALDVDSASLGSPAFHTWVTGEYTTLKAYCDLLHATCSTDTTSSSPCQRYLQPMEGDVSPGGQYALFDTRGNPLDLTNNVLYKYWRTQFPPTPPSDTTVYNQALLTLSNGTVTSVYDSTFTIQQLVQYWQPAWADKFLQYHPEYCKLQFCWNNETYERWDQTVQDSILLASQIHGIPGAPPGFHYDYTNGAWLVAADPFFKSGGAGAGMAAAFENDLLNYSKNIAGNNVASTKDLVKFVDFLLYCSDPNAKTNTLNNTTNNWDNCAPSSACRAPDREWATYQDYYFELKQNYYNKLRLKTTCANKCTVGTPETLPTASACPAATDFVIGDYSSADGAPQTSCDSIHKLVTLNYVPGNVGTTVKVTVQYPSGATTVFTFNKGNRNKMFCVADSIPSQSLTVQAVQCDSCQVSPLLFNTWVNDHISQKVYNSSGTVIHTNTITVDNVSLYGGTLTINANHTFNVVDSLRSYSGSWEQDSCTFSLYANNIKYTLNTVSADSLSLTHREGNTQETWYYTGTGLNITCSSPDTIHVTALQGTNAYFKGVYPARHLITVIAGPLGTPPPFNCINSSGVDTTSTSSYHTCLSIYTPYSTVKYQNVWVFDCVYDAVPSTCPASLLTKVSRFPDTFANPAIGDTSTVVAQNKQQLAQQADSTASSLAPSWKNALLPGLTAIGHAGDTTAIINDFTAISIQGSDLSHPYGSSSVPPGQTGPSGYNDFGAVIKGVTGITTFTTSLNPWLISQPYPYSPLMQGSYTTVANTNTAICALIAKYQHQCDSVNAAHGTSLTLYQYLSQTFGPAMIITSAQVDSLKKSCGSCNFILDQPVTLPLFMTPGSTGCITPAAYTMAKSALLTAFGGSIDTTNANYQTIYQNFMNQRWGFTLGYDDYKSYEDSLLTNPSKMLCNATISVAPPTDSLACVENQLAVGVANGKSAYIAYVDSLKDAFRASYVYTCSQPGPDVQLRAHQKIYHYTLYYYDQADNLVRTVPPEGVSLLTAEQMLMADQARNNTLPDCTYSGPATNASKTTAFNALSGTLSASTGAIEMWLYDDGSVANHLIEVTPDYKYMFQVSITASDTLGVDIYPLTSSNSTRIKLTTNSLHYRADISAFEPLNGFNHIVLQGNSLGLDTAQQLYFNGHALPTTTFGTPLPPGFSISAGTGTVILPDSIQTLKHLRLYSQPLSAAVIMANANSNCLMPTDSSHMTGWYRFNLPSPGGPTTINDSSTVETRTPAIYPAHRMATTYNYNSTNQVSTQNSPDGGTNRFWYDLLSRLVISQNDKQKPDSNYSYTKFDTLSRITEVGQKYHTASMGKPDYLQTAAINAFYAAGSNSQITNTYYDTVVTAGNGIQRVNQSNIAMRKRVSLTTYRATTADTVTQATYYSYDLDGNVNNLYQQIKGLGIKRIYYEYDLISGKVNFVGYQNGKADQYYYQYLYDADNRLTGAWSGITADTTGYGFGSVLDPATKKTDATYQYYLHGPLARMELGNSIARVQGVDYAYALQGWLKGVNSVAGGQQDDMGQDGISRDTLVAGDAYAYSLGYYNGDYTPIGGSSTYTAFAVTYSQTAGDITGQSLYNGNISNSTLAVNIFAPASSFLTPVGYTYHYDQLNRLKKMRQYNNFTGTSWGRSNITLAHQENFTYDGNGNILSLGRNGDTTVTAQTIDSLTYNYNRDGSGNLKNNKLNYVNDAISSSGYNLDLRNQTSTTNYRYDPIGNLVKDVYSGITNIGWTVFNKIDTIYKTAGNISYTYNTTNERTSKTEGGLTTWYVRDAQGNVLAIYDNKSDSVYWREQHLYGSSRIGMWQPNMNLATGSASSIWHIVGNKSYELDNHLGNVIATISDVRIPIRHGSGPHLPIDHYLPTVISAQDYYAFGMLQPGRQYTATGDSTYRYGFNGKENDNNVKGLGNEQDYGERIYDTRLGRFESVDPEEAEYPWNGSYNFAENDPISSIDIDGLEKSKRIGFWGLIGQGMKQGWDETKSFYKSTFSSKGIKGGVKNVKAGAKNVMGMVKGDPNAYKSFSRTMFSLSMGLNNTIQNYTTKPVVWSLGIPGRSEEENLRGLGYGLYKSLEVGSLLVLPELGGAENLGKSSVDLMGGETSSLGGEFINFDRQARFGISDDIANFSKYFGKSSVERMIANNPQAEFLPAVSESIEPGGTITIRGQMNNKFFKEIWTGKAKGFEDFEIVPGSQRTGLPIEGYTQSNGTPLRGDPNSLNEITLKKKK